MARRRAIVPLGLSVIEDSRVYRPGALASEIQNFTRTQPEDTLRSIRGPAVYETQDTITGRIHGLFHARIRGIDTLLMRAGSTLYRHAGWSQSWESLATGLTTPNGTSAPDRFCVFNDTIVWTNGIDRARVITADGQVRPLGFVETPPPPRVIGPAAPGSSVQDYPNFGAFSWWGPKGTPGDVLSGQSGAIQQGAWYYLIQYEDWHGNLSPLSAPSNPGTLRTDQADPTAGSDEGTEIDDLTRMFLVAMPSDAPENTKAVWLYSTSDTLHTDGTPGLVSRIAGRRKFVMGDLCADYELTTPPVPALPVPTFQYMTTHGGSLVIANTPGNPNAVLVSEPGFPGTFRMENRINIGTTGAEVTGIISHGGLLLAFTRTSIHLIEQTEMGLRERTYHESVGCLAGAALATLGDGSLMIIAADGIYRMPIQGRPQRVSDQIEAHFRDLNHTRFHQASAVYDVRNREWRCAIAEGSNAQNNLILVYDGDGFRRYDLGLTARVLARTDDERGLTLIGGRNPTANVNQVYVLDREHYASTPPAKTYRYSTGWLSPDGQGRERFNLKCIWLRVIESTSASLSMTLYTNGRPDAVYTQLFAPVDPDDQPDYADEAVIGTARFRDPVDHWLRADVDLFTLRSIRVEITGVEPAHVHLAGLAFEVATTDRGQSRTRIPEAAPRTT
jgi:hypothetical protein